LDLECLRFPEYLTVATTAWLAIYEVGFAFRVNKGETERDALAYVKRLLAIFRIYLQRRL
jgi:hypothetical protein